MHTGLISYLLTVKTVPLASEFFASLESLYVFMSASKAHEVFLEKQVELRPGKQTIQLKRLIETRWACRHLSIRAVRETYAAVLATLQTISQSNDKDKAVQAQGFIHVVTKFHFVLCLVVFDFLFGVTKALSDALQASDLDLASATYLISSVETIISESRSDVKWTKLWEEAVSFASEHGVIVTVDSSSTVRLHRVTQPPKRLDDCFATSDAPRIAERLASCKEYRSQLYYVTIDRILQEFSSRFSNPNKELMKAVQACSPKAANFLELEALKPLLELYSTKISPTSNTELELMHAKGVVSQAKPNAETLNDVIDALSPLRAAFAGLTQLLQIVLTLAVTTASCERSFSSLKRIKTYLRSSMGEQRLTSLSILAVERDLSSKIDMDIVVNKFAASNRRILL